MSNPKDKAKELFDSYWYCLLQSNIENRNYWSKQCALIAVDEIILSLDYDYIGFERQNKYYQEVKQEIELL